MTTEAKPEQTTKTAEERNADAFELGMGRTLKKEGITDPAEVQAFLKFAAAVANDEAKA